MDRKNIDETIVASLAAALGIPADRIQVTGDLGAFFGVGEPTAEDLDMSPEAVERRKQEASDMHGVMKQGLRVLGDYLDVLLGYASEEHAQGGNPQAQAAVEHANKLQNDFLHSLNRQDFVAFHHVLHAVESMTPALHSRLRRVERERLDRGWDGGVPEHIVPRDRANAGRD